MKQKKIPQRMCVGCQSMKTKKELLRVVRTPEGEILLDPTGKKAGRGAYVCPSDECLAKAVKAKRLEKALEHAISAEVFAALRAGLRQP
ncbi:MAG TPA: YlxR family protein [Negativicutes bacterium]|nr:YlxR family protein [Negativicutes bacterium]